MKKKVALLIAVVVLSLAGASFYLYKNNKADVQKAWQKIQKSLGLAEKVYQF